MTYLVLKAFHLVAIVLFLSGMLVLSLGLKAYQAGNLTAEMRQLILRWDRFATSPALGIVWIAGLSLAYLGDWYSDTWLHTKFAIVFLLSGLHGTLSGRLKRESGPSSDSRLPTYSLTGLCVATPSIILLAVLKPWL